MFWFAVFTATILALGYHRAGLRTATLALGGVLLLYGLLAGSFGTFVLLLLLFGAVLVPLNLPGLRVAWLTKPAFQYLRGTLPEISGTERTALEAGTVWWDGELFSGHPDWDRFAALPAPKLSAEEQAFLDGPVEELCRMLDSWKITHEEYDLPPEAWEFIRRNRFWGLIIPKRYGGLEFSAWAHSCVLAKVTTSPGGATAGTIVSVPNSLGPAELLLRYGTEEQKDHWLPRLADGSEIPCFALTSPWAGSDASAIPDSGVVCRGLWKGRETLGLRLNFDKRYITLAPVATVVGLAFRLHDPEQLLGGTEDGGITCALIPRDTPGLEIGARHLPLNIPFMNGPVRGHDVFVPLDCIIGGPAMAGKGWRMLMECLAVGRSISLPSAAAAGACAAAVRTGAYARIRQQFGLPIGEFEGVQEALGGLGGRAYAADAVRRLTAHAVDLGEKPAVPSAIAKLHTTEMAREAAALAMDVTGGKGIMLGPRNWLARGWQGAPIAVTVEGANLLTRNLIVFGQGALRCHPYVRAEIDAVADPDAEDGLRRFDAALWAHAGHAFSALARCVVLGLSAGRLAGAPARGGTRAHYQRISRYSANLALVTEAVLAVLGGRIKARERISARLGDVLGLLYVASAVLKRHDDDGRPEADLPFVHWACEDAFHRIEARLDGVLRHLTPRPLAWALRPLVFPLGRRARPPSDRLDRDIARALQRPGDTADRLASALFNPEDTAFAPGLLRDTLRRVIECEPLEQRLRQAARAGQLQRVHPLERIGEAAERGLITPEEARRLTETLRQVEEVCRVDEFAPGELGPVRPRRGARARMQETT